MRRDYEERLRRMEQSGLNQSLGETLSELSAYDNHPADIGDELHERSKDMSLQSLLQRRIEEVDAALEALAEGTYGKCQNCGRPIPEPRLQAQPTAIFCTECQEQKEASAGPINSSAEEEILADHMRRIYADTLSVDPGYDREDAWQEVERYGTSTTGPHELDDDQ